MSNIFPASELGEAQSVAIGALGQVGSGGTFHARFADGQQVMRPRTSFSKPDASPKADPLELARADGFAQGLDEGLRVATETFAADQEVKLKLANALELVAPAANGALSPLLSAAVIRLVTQIVGELPINTELLTQRVEAVAAFIEEEQGRHSLHINPEDISLLDGHEFGFAVIADNSVARGNIRLDTADGWIEHGLDVQLSRLKALLDDMEGRG